MADQDHDNRQTQAIDSVHDYFLRPVTRESDVDAIFSYLRNFIDDLSRGNFTNEQVFALEAIVDKFLHAVKHYADLAPKDIDLAKQLAEVVVAEVFGVPHEIRRRVHSPSSLVTYLFARQTQRERSELWQQTYQKCAQLHTHLVAIYNTFAAQRDSKYQHLDMDDFYLPDLADKQRASVLIEDAVNLIDQDNTLNRRAKDRILAHLRRAIGEMHKPRTDWSVYFGHVKEAIIVLGAIGSIVGGQCVLLAAKDKIEEATQVIEHTSINQNYLSLTYNQLTSQTFHLARPAGSQAEPASLTLPATLPSRTDKNTEDAQQSLEGDTTKVAENDGLTGANDS